MGAVMGEVMVMGDDDDVKQKKRRSRVLPGVRGDVRTTTVGQILSTIPPYIHMVLLIWSDRLPVPRTRSTT